MLLINMSRVGKNGTGLYAFSRHAVRALCEAYGAIEVASPREVALDIESVRRRYVPSFVAMTQKVSRLRPIIWAVYSLFLFRNEKSKIYCTTHHAVGAAKNQIITIHDLRPYFYPDSLIQGLYFRHFLKFASKRVDAIVTVSQATKALIVEKYGIAPSRIHVVPNAVDLSKYSPGDEALDAEPPYLLMVGATWAHKNAHEVLERAGLWGDKYRLKIALGEGKYRQALQDLVRRRNLESAVEFIGYVSEKELIRLYQNASALVYPSIMEGFGIPPLEAMACGVPAIVSDIPVFREIYGDAAIFVGLGNEDSWRRAIATLEDKALVESLRTRGTNRARSYTEQRMGEALCAALIATWPELATHRSAG